MNAMLLYRRVVGVPSIAEKQNHFIHIHTLSAIPMPTILCKPTTTADGH